jgi:hypothetical protein
MLRTRAPVVMTGKPTIKRSSLSRRKTGLINFEPATCRPPSDRLLPAHASQSVSFSLN